MTPREVFANSVNVDEEKPSQITARQKFREGRFCNQHRVVNMHACLGKIVRNLIGLGILERLHNASTYRY